MKKLLLASLLLLCTLSPALARTENLGVHILHPYEFADAATLLKTADNATQWTYVTIPLSLDDLERHDEWQAGFQTAAEHHLQPIVRLTSSYDPTIDAWRVPTRADIIALFDFLSALDWPTDDRFVIIYNEPNHAAEWGGTLDPASYARVLRFATAWAHTEGAGYRVLPAAMDLAAPNGPTTMEAFTYLEGMLAADPHVFDTIDYWNSHSYPNPGFSSSPSRTTQDSLVGFTHELAWLEDRTGLQKDVLITETGWQATSKTLAYLSSYYQAARELIWSDERVVAVTPFLLRGDPGPFSAFTLLTADGEPTRQYQAYAAQIAANAQEFRTMLESAISLTQDFLGY